MTFLADSRGTREDRYAVSQSLRQGADCRAGSRRPGTGRSMLTEERRQRILAEADRMVAESRGEGVEGRRCA